MCVTVGALYTMTSGNNHIMYAEAPQLFKAYYEIHSGSRKLGSSEVELLSLQSDLMHAVISHFTYRCVPWYLKESRPDCLLGLGGRPICRE